MADILIKGLALPKGVNHPLFIRISSDGHISKGDFLKGGFIETEATAIELPPHGRLIDAKEFACQVYAGVCGAENYCDYKCDSCHAKIIVNEFLPVAPTIVEASSGSDN